MKLHKKSLGIIGAAFCVLLLTFALAVGVAHARYNNNISWTGYYAPGVQTISSDLLKREGQTVVLQPWEAAVGSIRSQSIQLFTSKGSAYVTVQCTSDSDYITAALDQSALYATQSGATVNLQLTVGEKATWLTEITQAKVSVTVKNADQSVTLKADYQILLLPEGMSVPNLQESDLQANLTVSPSQAERTFAWEEKLVFTLEAQTNADSIELMYNGDVFPEGTRYTIDQDQYVLADGMTIKIPITPGVPKPVAIDFSQANTTRQQLVHITAVACLGNQISDQIDFSARTTRTPLTIGEISTAPVITHTGSITVPITGDEEGLVLLVQQLKKTDSGTMYVQSSALSLQLKPDENSGAYLLEISNQAGKAPAGTYRLTLVRMCGDQLVSTCQMTFFVHY